jgi:signal transduction histidine kinase
LRKNLAELKKRRPPNKQEELIFNEIDSAVNSLETMMEEAQTLADQFEKGRSEVIHLAGLGLMVEFVAHELNRATQHALGTLGESNHTQKISGPALKNLELQLKTLQKRLSSLDPASVTGRNRKESFDLSALAQDVLDGHEAEFKRHHIEAPKVKGIGGSPKLQVNMVKGMVIQILENLLSNSIYWIKQEQRVRRSLAGKIEIAINPTLRTLQVTDNGPGVSNEVADNIFQAFFTTKPPGLGKGLGLYISKELAHYHEAELELSSERLVHKDRYNTFVLTLPK